MNMGAPNQYGSGLGTEVWEHVGDKWLPAVERPPREQEHRGQGRAGRAPASGKELGTGSRAEGGPAGCRGREEREPPGR